MRMTPYIPAKKTPEEAARVYLTAEKALFAETRDRVRDWAVKYYGPNWVEIVKAESNTKAIEAWKDERDPFYIFKCLSFGHFCPLQASLGDPVGLALAAKRVVNSRNAWAHFSMDLRMESIRADIVNLLLFAKVVKLSCAKDIGDSLDALDKASTSAVTATEVVPPASDTEDEVVLAGAGTKKTQREEVVRPRSGESWAGPLPSTRCDLNGKIRDVRVVNTGESLTSRWSSPELANQAIERWFRLKPTPTTLYVDEEDGATVGFIAGYPYFFGYAGPEPELGPDQYRGFIDPRVLEYVNGQLVEQETQKDFLATTQSREDILAQIAAVDAPNGSTIRVTNYGDLVLVDDHGAKRIATIPPAVFLAIA